MIEPSLALILFLFPLAFSPGPGNLVFAATGAQYGFTASLPANLGYHLATWLVTATIGLAFAQAVDLIPTLVQPMKWVGAAYVLWIAWKTARSGAQSGSGAAPQLGIWDGAMLLALNPKAYVIIALMFSQFGGAFGVERVTEALLITTIFTLNNMLSFTLWTLAGNQIRQIFATDMHAQAMNLMFGSLLAAVAVWMLLA